MELQQAHLNNVVALKGNHEMYFLQGLRDLQSGEGDFLSVEERNIMLAYDDKEALTWVSSLPTSYETEDQIFVHAGVDEEAGEFWKFGTTDDDLTGWHPPNIGKFYKDVVAGHAGTHSKYLANAPDFHEAYFDGYSHYYIDGATERSGIIPVLKYNTTSKRYTTFQKTTGKGGSPRWLEREVFNGRTDSFDSSQD